MGSITAGKHFCGSLPFYGWGELAARDRGCERVHGSRDRRFVVYGRPKARGRGKGAPLPRLAADPSLRAGDGRWFAVKREIDYVVPVTHRERFGVSGGKLRSMNPLRSYWKSLATLAVVILPACAGAARAEPNAGPRPSAASTAELEALYNARQDSARSRFTVADVRFMTGMIGHHAQALVMANMAPTHGASPAVQTLAARIINAQQDEIAIIQTWLRERRQPVPEVHITGTELMVHGADHALHMPGMLTKEQIQELDRARGAEFDRLFLTYMIQHHRGAVTMVHELFRTEGAGQDEAVFKFASDVQVDQATEIARMESMLAALPPRRDARS